MLNTCKKFAALAVAALAIAVPSSCFAARTANAQQPLLLQKDVAPDGFGDESGFLLSTLRENLHAVRDNNEGYEALISSLSEYSLKRGAEREAIYDDLVRDAKELRAEIDEERQRMNLPFSYEEEICIRRSDASVLSYLRQSYCYAGGTRGAYSVWGVTYDVPTGRELTILDVITDRKAFVEAATKELLAAHPNNSFTYAAAYDAGESLRSKIDEAIAGGKLSWNLEPEGLAFHFDPYEIASYVEGVITTTLRYEDYPHLFREAYKRAPKSYAVELSDIVPLHLTHVAGQRISKDFSKRTYGDIRTFESASYDDQGDVESMRSYFLQLEDGRQYIYASCNIGHRNGSSELRVYEVTADGVVRIPGSRKLSIVEVIDGAAQIIYPITDPHYFTLIDKLDAAKPVIVDNYSPGKPFQPIYRVGTDGWPEAVH